MNIVKMVKSTCFRIMFSLVFIAQLNASELAPMVDKSIFEQGYPEPAERYQETLNFTELNNVTTRMTGTSPNAMAEFAVHPDTLVNQLALDFSINYSPALLAELSHIKLYLNDYLMATLDLPKQTDTSALNSQQHWTIPLQAQVLKDYNQIRYELVGYYTEQCQDDFNKNIWAEIARNSKLNLTYQALSIDSELALLPAPFFYNSLNKMLDLPVVFGQQPNTTMLESAAIVSSWFGQLADWRKSNISTKLNQLPNQHAVVIADNQSRPDFLRNYPLVENPTIEIISNPKFRYKKILLILGKDAKQVKQAALSLAHASELMVGRSVEISQPPLIEKRQAYDAPRWISSNETVPFSELIRYPDQLQVKGMGSAARSLNLRFAPDLFIWRDQGVDLDLQYRYTPSKSVTDTRLNLLINGQFMQGFMLEEYQQDKWKLGNVSIPFTEPNPGENIQSIEIPSFKLSADNVLTFDFSFAVAKSGACSAAPKDSNYGRIDENSSISLAGYEHYIKMPDLRVFAQSGFPFTKYADLQQTLVLIGKNPSVNEYDLLLNSIAHMSASTGYPASYLTIKNDLADVNADDYDLLIIGQPKNLIKENNQTLDVLVSQYKSELNRTLYAGQTKQKVNIELKSRGDLASILSFQSPYDNERTVVALYANSDSAYPLITQIFQQPESLNKITGAANVINQYGITQIESQDSYYVGSLPIHQLIWYHLSDYPVILGLLSVLVLLVLSVIIWRLLKVLTAKRLAEGDE